MSESDKQTKHDAASSGRTLPRREWLAGVVVGGAVAATATLGYESCETTPRSPDSPELELGYIKTALQPLKELDYVAEGKRKGLLSQDIQDELSADINQYLSTTYQALVYSELVNALPDDLRKSDEVQSDLATMSPVLDQAVADAYFVVGMADDETKKQIDRELRENPDVLMDMASGLDDEGARHGMGMRGRLRLRRASRQLSAQLRMQSTDELVTDLTNQLTRYAERNGARAEGDSGLEVSPAARRMLAQYDDPLGSTPPPQPGGEVESSPPPEAESPSAGESPAVQAERRREIARLERKEKSLTRASRGLAGAGGGLLIVGGIALGVTGMVGAAVPMCIGGFLLLIALFVLAARARRRRQLEEERARLNPTEVQ